MFEHFTEPLVSGRVFYLRMARYALFAGLLICGSLAIGVLGYHGLCGLDWIDSLLNASMILAGMGPVNPMHTTAAKLFASAYAIFSGVAFLSTVGVFGAPVVHRFLHRFHVDELDDHDDGSRKPGEPRA